MEATAAALRRLTTDVERLRAQCCERSVAATSALDRNNRQLLDAKAALAAALKANEEAAAAAAASAATAAAALEAATAAAARPAPPVPAPAVAPVQVVQQVAPVALVCSEEEVSRVTEAVAEALLARREDLERALGMPLSVELSARIRVLEDALAELRARTPDPSIAEGGGGTGGGGGSGLVSGDAGASSPSSAPASKGGAGGGGGGGTTPRGGGGMKTAIRAAMVARRTGSVLNVAGDRSGHSTLLQQFERERVVQSLLQSKTFTGMAHEDARLLVDSCEIRRFSPGNILIHQGSLGSYMFFISDGEVVIFVDDGHTRRELIRRYRGEIVGEFGLVSNNPRAASVSATAPVTALQIDRVVIEELVLTNPGSTIMAVMDRLLNFSARRSAGFASSSDET